MEVDNNKVIEQSDRQYQIELYNAAKKKNTIICLGTGTGKTYIAILLIKDPKFAKQLNGKYLSDAKRTIFLVPTVPLVKQQAEAIRRHVGFAVGQYVGHMDVDKWKKDKWDKELEDHQILVMTAQIFLDMLNRGYIQFNKVNLLVIDEVHRAAKTKANKDSGHPYKQIMNRYHDSKKSLVLNQRSVELNLPRVVGLTASLLNCTVNVESFEDAIKDLEKTCDSVCITASDAQLCATNPREEVILYQNTYSSFSSNTELVLNCLNSFVEFLRDKTNESKSRDKNKKVSLGFDKIQKCLTDIINMLPQCKDNTMSWMGIWCANMVINIYLKQYKLYQDIYEHPDPNKAEVFRLTILLLNRIRSEFTTELNSPDSAMKTASPKMHLALNILKKYKPDNNCDKSRLCGIVFVNERSVAKVLTKWLNELKKLNPQIFGFLNVGYVVGHSSAPGVDSIISSRSHAKQEKIIEKFHKSELNLLVATSVLEEGLDVRQCNLVVRYDKPKTFREYLQSKGRARAVDADYYILVTNEDSRRLDNELKNYKKFEEKIKALTNERSITPRSDDCENDSSDEEEEKERNEETKAVLTEREAIGLLYKYCAQLELDSFTKLTPSFQEESNNGMYRFSVKLPIYCLIKKTIYGEYHRNKTSAKRNAAYKACMQLHLIGELDNRFLPVSKEKSIEEHVKRLGLNRYLNDDKDSGTKKRKRSYQKKLAQVFSKRDVKGNTYYLHGIKLDYELINSLNSDPITFGAITYKPVENSCSFPVFVKSGRVEVQFVPLNSIQMNAQQKESIEKFHRFIFSEVLRLENDEIEFSPNDTKFFLLVVPMKNEREIYWDFVHRVNSENPIEVKPVPISDRLKFSFNKELYKDCVFYPWYRKEESVEFYNAIEVTNMNPSSQFIESKKYETYAHYYRQIHNIEICNQAQQLIAGKRVENFAQLKEFVIKKKTAKMMDKIQYFVPELLAIHPFPRSLWIQALCLPAILYRLNYLLLTEELRESISLESCIRFSNSFNNMLSLNYQVKSEKLDHFSFDWTKLEERFNRDHSCDRLPNKKPCNEYTIQRLNDKSNQRSGDLSSHSNTSNVDSSPMDLPELIRYLKARFDFLYSDAEKSLVNREGYHKIEEENDCNKSLDIFDNKPLRFGESFAFIFSKHIEGYMDEKYDSSPSHVICCPTAAELLNALTLVNASDFFDLERLETIGDSFLKLMTTVYVFFECPGLDEGKLTDLRTLQISNKNLYHIGLKKGIEQLIVATKFEPKLNWLPPSYKTNDHNERLEHSVSDKSIADSIEALIGAFLLKGGHKSAIIFMQWLGLKVISKTTNTDDSLDDNDSDIWQWLPSPQSPILEHISNEEANRGLKELYDNCHLNEFENEIGYEFKNKAFLVLALTHSSYSDNQITDCYQRLEFVGDAILDYLITRKIYKDSDKLTPGELTDLRSALVNNSLFTCIAVKFNFHKYLKYLSFDLFRAIDYFEKKFKESRVKSVESDEEDDDLEEVEIPKVLGDVFESVAGAIFLDNGLSIEGVWSVYYELLKPEIVYFSENIPKMPVRQLREIAPEVQFSLDTESEDKTSRKIRIVAKVNGKEYLGIGINKKLAKIAASKRALKDIVN